MWRPLLPLAAAAALVLAQERDPEILKLVSEAQAILARDPAQPNGPKDLHAMAGNILAKAGYVDEAEEAFRKSRDYSAANPPRVLVIYGPKERADKVIKELPTAKDKASTSLSFGTGLLLAGRRDEARVRLLAAQEFAREIPDANERGAIMSTIKGALRSVETSRPARPPAASASLDLNRLAATHASDPRTILTQVNYWLSADPARPRAIIDPTRLEGLSRCLAAADVQCADHLITTQIGEDSGGIAPYAKGLAYLAIAQVLRTQDKGEQASKLIGKAYQLAAQIRDVSAAKVAMLTAIAKAEPSEAAFRSVLELVPALPAAQREFAYFEVLRNAVSVRQFKIAEEVDGLLHRSGASPLRVQPLWKVMMLQGMYPEALEAARRIDDKAARAEGLLSIAHFRLLIAQMKARQN